MSDTKVSAWETIEKAIEAGIEIELKENKPEYKQISEATFEFLLDAFMKEFGADLNEKGERGCRPLAFLAQLKFLSTHLLRSFSLAKDQLCSEAYDAIISGEITL